LHGRKTTTIVFLCRMPTLTAQGKALRLKRLGARGTVRLKETIPPPTGEKKGQMEKRGSGWKKQKLNGGGKRKGGGL